MGDGAHWIADKGAMTVTLEEARAWDAADPLTGFRSRFNLPPGVIYLDGNSLGPPPVDAARRLTEATTQAWGEGLVRSWNDADWIGAPARVGGKIAGLIGAKPGEVIVADSTSVNLYKLLVATLRARPERRKILTEAGDFPTDGYIAQGVARDLPGAVLEMTPRDDLAAALHSDVAVLLLSHVHYKTAERRDMAQITRLAHAAGAWVLWDLSHSVGALAIDLRACHADLAVGCGYKFLNGGPGAPAFLFIAERLPGRSDLSAGRLDGPRRSLRLRRRLASGCGRRRVPLRHAPDPQPGRARGRRRSGPRSRPARA